MGEGNSPHFSAGLADGARDAQLLGSCPPGVPIGPTPVDENYRVMYDRGYHRIFDGAVPHSCPKCTGRSDG